MSDFGEGEWDGLGDGPDLEDFLARDASELPFLRGGGAIEDDWVEYRLFTDEWESLEGLQQVRESVLELVQELAAGYIWHHEAFQLGIRVSEDDSVEPHFWGRSLVGGNISDEWFICFIMFEITRRFPGLTGCLIDMDGQLLLIEAAAALPRFLQPHNSDNRVWLREGQVHLVMPGAMIDRARAPKTLGSGPITLMEGLKAVREQDGATEADERVQRAIEQRIQGYPERAISEHHRVRCILPLSAAVVLRRRPGLVAEAVRTYCSRTPTDSSTAVAVKMDRLLPNRDGPCFVEARVMFTRHLYAQLSQAPLLPAPKAFPPNWGPACSGRLPPGAREKAKRLGQKLSMGLEMAYRMCSDKCKLHAGGDVASLVGGQRWSRFLSGLDRMGFFEGELEGSARYREKMVMAEHFVRDHVLTLDASSVTDTGAAAETNTRRGKCQVHEKMDEALLSSGDIADFPAVLEDDDEDKWMEVSAQDLDWMMRGYSGHDDHEEGKAREHDPVSPGQGDSEQDAAEWAMGGAQAGEYEDGVSRGVSHLEDMVVGLNAFLDDETAGADGAEMPADWSADGGMEFNVERFMRLLNGDDLTSALSEAADDPSIARLGEAGPSYNKKSGSSGGGDELLETDSDDEEGSDGEGGQEVGVGHHPSPGARRHGKEHEAGEAAQEVKGADSDDEELPGTAKSTDAAAVGANKAFFSEYMDAMDAELESSTAGESFVKVGQNPQDGDGEPVGNEARRLASIGPILASAPGDDPDDGDDGDGARAAVGEGDLDHEGPGEAQEEQDHQPVDADLNLVTHLLESSASQMGMSGPASNLLRSMGLSFPSMPPRATK